MGLDICVRKILKEPKKEDDLFYLMDDDGNYNNSQFPDWTKEFEKESIDTLYDWNKYKDETGIDVEQYECKGIEYGLDGNFMKLWPNSAGKYPEPSDFKTGEDSYDWKAYEKAINEHLITVDLDKVPTYEKPVKVLYYEEVGYQRKGFNKQFYDDYDAGKIGYFVWSKKELERYKEDYCVDEQIKEEFQVDIIDKFVDGETCCIFSW